MRRTEADDSAEPYRGDETSRSLRAVVPVRQVGGPQCARSGRPLSLDGSPSRGMIAGKRTCRVDAQHRSRVLRSRARSANWNLRRQQWPLLVSFHRDLERDARCGVCLVAAATRLL